MPERLVGEDENYEYYYVYEEETPGLGGVQAVTDDQKEQQQEQ